MNNIAGSFFLIGLMGAGKTTIGRALARRLNKTFYDSDQEIESRTGVKISTIFDIEGEDRFREREAEVMSDLMSRREVVLATGGGAVLHHNTRHRLRQFGIVIYLRADVEELYVRTSYDKSRPLLQTDNPFNVLNSLFIDRDPVYTDLAHVILDTGRQSVTQIVQILINTLGNMPDSLDQPFIISPHDNT